MPRLTRSICLSMVTYVNFYNTDILPSYTVRHRTILRIFENFCKVNITILCETKYRSNALHGYLELNVVNLSCAFILYSLSFSIFLAKQMFGISLDDRRSALPSIAI